MAKQKPKSKAKATPQAPKGTAPKGRAVKGKAKLKSSKGSFGINLGEMFFGSVEAFFKSPLQSMAAGLITMGAGAGLYFWAESLLDGNEGYLRTLAIILAATVMGTIALPWYFYSLARAEGKKISWAAPFSNPRLFWAQAVCSFWLWAAITLGYRYLLGIPALVAVVFYAFHGYVIADGGADRGLAALGNSVQLGHGRRLGLLMIAAMLSVFFVLGASTLGMEEWSQTAKVAGAVVGTALTGSIIMISGAKIYLVLEKDL